MRSDSVELGLKEGWALYDRPTPKALAGKAQNYAKELFEAGQANRNARVTPESAAEKMMQKFPTEEECWLSAKQVRLFFDCIFNIVVIPCHNLAPVAIQSSLCRCLEDRGGGGQRGAADRRL